MDDTSRVFLYPKNQSPSSLPLSDQIIPEKSGLHLVVYSSKNLEKLISSTNNP
ncbi:hypothetical protein Aconfl_24230 [Algoriphagus confluentis]|uniref:Uncharacterized protein n=1 Tax=Algoriphagus confluentis TaxID=1697556 RepID=A0ABQ6PPA3_9BACT|nr:hypothetical protein Aconfl_24230 [Algoriphagus confluentis]